MKLLNTRFNQVLLIYCKSEYYIVPSASLQSVEELEVHAEEMKVQDISSSDHEESNINEIYLSNQEVRIQEINHANNEDEEDKMEF